MIKPLLVVLVIVILLAISLNFDFFADPIKPKETLQTSHPKKVQVESIEKTVQVPVIVEETKFKVSLAQELEKLLRKAKRLFQKNQDAEALSIYEEIIERSINSHEVKILKLFSEASFDKATLHYIYPNNDMNSAIETYELMIKKLHNSSDKDLLITYMKAKIQQAQFSSKDELLTVYDELIEKFNKDAEQRFEKEIEELLISKSFALMGVNDEEAIEVLDSLIAKYDDKTKLSQSVQYSILNNIELSIITSNEPDKYVDLANQYMADSPDTKPLLDMLSIIKNAQDLEQTEALELWNNEHADYSFPDWDFSELRKWVQKMETPEIQTRINAYLDIFEKQKYKNYYQAPSTKPTQHTVENEEGSLLYTTDENAETPNYEADPYLNDIYPNQQPSPYPDPYVNINPNGGESVPIYTDDY